MEAFDVILPDLEPANAKERRNREKGVTPTDPAKRRIQIAQGFADEFMRLRRAGYSQPESMFTAAVSFVEYLRRTSGRTAAMNLVSELEAVALGNRPVSPWEDVMPR
jgi:hypothetical protein